MKKTYNILLIDEQDNLSVRKIESVTLTYEGDPDELLAGYLRDCQAKVSNGEAIAISHHIYTSNGKMLIGLKACSNSNLIHFVPFKIK